MKNYGITYQGSKSKIAPEILSCIPSGTRLIDMFGGGAAITDCAVKIGKWQQVVYNELNPLLFNLIKDAINGKYSYENGFVPDFITKEKFNELKDTDGYVKYIWSFGCSGKNYMFSDDISGLKQIVHNAIFEIPTLYDSNLELLKLLPEWQGFPSNITNFKDRRLFIMGYIKKLKGRFELQQLERLERLQQLQQLERLQQLQQLERLIMTNFDYQDFPIKPNDIIYCDPPYKNTAKYDYEFNHDEFWQWIRECPNLVFVSEYSAPDDFKPIFQIKKSKLMSQKGDTGKAIENLYCNKQIKTDLFN